MGNQVALVTGSAKGMGRCIANHLAKKGYDIIVHSRNLSTDFRGEGAMDTMREVEALGQKAYLCLGDLGTEEGRAKVIKCVD